MIGKNRNSDERVTRLLERDDRRDRMEQKLGIDRMCTKLRDERALREYNKLEKERNRK